MTRKSNLRSRTEDLLPRPASDRLRVFTSVRPWDVFGRGALADLVFPSQPGVLLWVAWVACKCSSGVRRGTTS